MLCLVVALLPALLSAQNIVRIIYVDDNAPGANNGTSWFNAYNFLQDALAVAQQGDALYVAQGVYRPNQAYGPSIDGRTSTFALKDGVTLWGGYAGYAAPQPSLRNWRVYETILSGDLLANDVPVDVNDKAQINGMLTDPTRADNSYSVVTGTNVSPSAVLDGFIITAGNADGEPDFSSNEEIRGGAMFLQEASPTIRNCTVIANTAEGQGGGVANYQADPNFIDCQFIANYSVEGGGALLNDAGDPNFVDCVFTQNRVHFNGTGGVMFNQDSNPTVVDSEFVANYGGRVGGAMNNSSSDPTITGCKFIGNSSRSMAGALSLGTGTYPVITDCVFRQNEASWRGGALYLNYCTPTLTNCIFAGNEASAEGGVVFAAHSEPLFVNCLFTGNEALVEGGALAHYDTDLSVINCTFSNNLAQKGRAISCKFASDIYRSHVQVRNSILWDDGAEIFNGDGSVIEVLYSDVQGGWEGWGNIFANPMFASPLGFDGVAGTEDDDLHLLLTSPCIDAAENFAVPIDVVTDLDGRARFADVPSVPDTGNGAPPIVDMGAYEYGSTTPGPGPGPGPGPNHAPVANAGPDQVAFAWMNGMANVTLDGSDSYDQDGDPLLYSWHWVVGPTFFDANGVNPTIQLPLGVHNIQLLVSDYSLTSVPDQTLITVVEPIDGQLWLYPYGIKRGNCGSKYIIAMVRLYEISENQVDLNEPVTIYPGGTESYYKYTFQHEDGIVVTTVVALFNKAQLLASIPNNGIMDMTVVGKLKSGQYFAGTDKVMISNCGE